MKGNVFAFNLTDKTPWITFVLRQKKAQRMQQLELWVMMVIDLLFINLSLDRRIGKHLCSLFGVTLFYWIIHFLKQRIALDVQINASSIEQFVK